VAIKFKFQLPKNALITRFLANRWARYSLIAFVAFSAISLGVFTYYYNKYARVIEDKLRNGPFANTSMLYAAPQPVSVGDQTRPEELADYLRRAGYTESNRNPVGWYHVRPDAIEINPGPEAFDSEGAVIKIQRGVVSQIISLRDQSERTLYNLEPEPITNLFDQKREKRRIVR
jgi:penicillin-binding protein 1B